MIKKYVMLISAILVILMFTSTSTASFLFSEGKIYEQLPENSPLRNILDRFSQVIVSNNDNSMLIDDDKEEDETDDEDDGEYDDGEHDDEIDHSSPDKKGVDTLLPNVLEEGFYWTPDGGNEPVVEPSNTIDNPDGYEDGSSSGDGIIDYPDGETNNEMMTIDEDGESPCKWTVDSNGEEGTINDNIITEADITDESTQDEVTVDSGEDEGTAGNEITIPDYIDEGEWTVETKPMTVKLERFVKIVTELNGKLGATLQRVIERTVATDENDISSPGSGGSAENNIVDNIVVTAGDQ